MKRLIYGLFVFLKVLPVYAQPFLLFGESVDATGLLPVGWQAHRWAITDQTPSPGSGGFSFVLQGRNADRLCTPVFDAQAAHLDTLSYLARRTGSYPALHLSVRASIDGGRTFPFTIATAEAALPAAEGSWTMLQFPLPAALSGAEAIQLCFDALGGTGASARLQLDDIKLYGTGQLRRWTLAVQPTQVDAGFVAVGDTLALRLSVRNQTDTALVITLPTPPAPWWVSRSLLMLDPRQTDTLTLYVAPTQADTFAAIWALLLPDDTLRISLHGTATLPVRYLGWQLPNATARAHDTLQVDLQLQVASPAPALQGLLFRMLTPRPRFAFLDVQKGPSLPNPMHWMLQSVWHGDTLQVLLLGEAAHPLPPGSYPALLQLQLVPEEVSDTTRLILALMAIEATEATPEASSVTLARYPRRLALSIRPRIAQAVLFPDTLRLPATPVGTRQSAMAYLSNPGGERWLHARFYPSLDPTLTVSPDSVAVSPNDTVGFAITFRPTLRDFGWRRATVRIQHDGFGHDTLLVVEAVGTGGLGDATEDGAVDVADLQRGIRYALALEKAEAQDRLVLDVAPFPYGDGQLRLDDLSLLVQAIARNSWPDESPLPIPPPSTLETVGKQEIPLIFRPVVETEGRIRLEVEAARPFSALQLALPPAVYEATGLSLPRDAYVQAGIAPDRLTLLLYRLDGASFAPGRYQLGALQATRVDTLRPLRWVAVDEIGHYLPTAIQTAGSNSLEPHTQTPIFFPPYPQPFSPIRHTALVLSGILPVPSAFTLELFDLLGRRLAWEEGQLPAGAFQYTWEVRNGQDHLLTPGLYLLRLRTPAAVQAFPLVVLY